MLNYNFIGIRFTDREWQNAASRISQMTFLPADWERVNTEPELTITFRKSRGTVVSYGKKDYTALRIEQISRDGQNYPVSATEFTDGLWGYTLCSFILDGKAIFPAVGIEDLGFFSRKNRWTELTGCLPKRTEG